MRKGLVHSFKVFDFETLVCVKVGTRGELILSFYHMGSGD